MDNNDLKISLSLRDNFAVRRHKEHVFLASLRSELAMKILKKRDSIAKVRHQERIEILTGKGF